VHNVRRQSIYKLSKKIARGGMAEIYLASKKGPDGFRRICCVKSILPHYASEKEFIDMFRDEAKLCQSLQHANVVRVEDFQEVNNSWAIIMEFVPGSDLRALLAACEKSNRSLSLPMICWIGAEIARGLHYAHTKLDDLTGRPLGIVHRDVSPQNILISFEGEVKVTDFGIAEAEDKVNETKPGMVKGKYAYMSPEQIIANPVDARTDVFALAVVMWEAISMKRLFHSDIEAHTIDMVRNCKLPADFFNNGGDPVAPELKAIIYKALRKEPKERWKSAEEFEQALRKYLYSKHPSFGAHELAQFCKEIIPGKFAEIQKQIKEALTAVDLDDEDTGLSTTDRISQKDIANGLLQNRSIIAESLLSDLTHQSQKMDSSSSASLKLQNHTGQHRNVGQTGSGNKTSPPDRNDWSKPVGRVQQKANPKNRQITLLNLAMGLLGFLCFAIILNYFLNSKPSFGQVTFRFAPARVMIQPPQGVTAINAGGAAVNVDLKSYIKGPITFKMESGNYDFTFQRDGFEPKKLRIKINASGEKTTNIVLKKNSIPAPVSLILQGDQPATFSLKDDLDSGSLNPNGKYNLQDLFHNRTYELTVKVPQSKIEFQCRFEPRSQNWTNPFIVLIIPQAKTCQTQAPY